MRGAVGVIVLVGYAIGVLVAIVAVVIVCAGNVQAEEISCAVDRKLLEGAGNLELLIDHLQRDRRVYSRRQKKSSHNPATAR